MSYTFADGEEGFPGALTLRLIYRVTGDNELVLEYEAVAHGQRTVASFTTHAFFNLEGEASRDVLGHEVTIPAPQYFRMTPQLIATGEVLPVEGTVYDLRAPVTLGSRIGKPHPSGAPGIATAAQTFAGYDDCFLLKPAPGQLTLCARVYAPESGRVMDVLSTEPALQFYTGVVAGQALAGGQGKLGRTYLQQQSLCLEPQGYPNAPNVPTFGTSVHEPGQARSGKTVYRFGVRAAAT
jgi:aldose 1-epimerase